MATPRLPLSSIPIPIETISEHQISLKKANKHIKSFIAHLEDQQDFSSKDILFDLKRLQVNLDWYVKNGSNDHDLIENKISEFKEEDVEDQSKKKKKNKHGNLIETDQIEDTNKRKTIDESDQIVKKSKKNKKHHH
jgi:translation elongation factor EF-1beta